jgi:hypothetical protein
MQPGVDLQIAILFRGQAQFYATISTNKGILTESCAVLDGQMQEPLVYRTPANFATFLAHRRGQGGPDAYIMVISLIGPWSAWYRIGSKASGCPCKTFDFHLTSNLGIGGIRRRPDEDGIYLGPRMGSREHGL